MLFLWNGATAEIDEQAERDGNYERDRKSLADHTPVSSIYLATPTVLARPLVAHFIILNQPPNRNPIPAPESAPVGSRERG